MDRYLPLICVGAFLVGLVVRILVHIARHRQSGIMLFRTGTYVQHFYDAILVIIVAVLVVQAVRFAESPAALDSMMLLNGDLRHVLSWIGAPVCIVAMLMAVIAQVHLGSSWRIGIDSSARPGLVTVGLYQQSRNPIFLFMFLAVAGYVLLLPTWLSLLALIATFLGIRRQIREEERWLLQTYGDEYRAYSARVGRFVKWWGRN